MSIRFDTHLLQSDAVAQGLTQTEIARRAKVGQVTVSRFMRGESRSPVTAKKIAKALGYSVRRYILPATDSVAV